MEDPRQISEGAGMVSPTVRQASRRRFFRAAGTATAGVIAGAAVHASPALAAPGASFYALAPGRLYDSRNGYNTLLGGFVPYGPVRSGLSLRAMLANRLELTVGTFPIIAELNYVPLGATAIAANVTVVNTVGSGYLAINPGFDTAVKAATVNWFASDQVLNNGVVLTLGSDRGVTIICGGSADAQAHVVIDVTGYFM